MQWYHIPIAWLNMYVNSTAIHVIFLTIFHVRFLKLMTSMHISLIACISDKIEEKNYIFAMVSKQKKNCKKNKYFETTFFLG